MRTKMGQTKVRHDLRNETAHDVAYVMVWKYGALVKSEGEESETENLRMREFFRPKRALSHRSFT
jgi:hypothetical protein